MSHTMRDALSPRPQSDAHSMSPQPSWHPGSTLLTDWYQLTMLAGYGAAGLEQTAVFELSVRRLPAARRFLMCAGLELVLAYLEQLHCSEAELAWLAGTGRLDQACLDRLARLRFTGDVDAMPEGTVCFADEPLLRITAPLVQAQLIESRVLNLMHGATLMASKAARCVLAAPGKLLMDFGMRRAHGAEAALLAARSSWLAGFDGTATVLAGLYWGVPVMGTMAHSWIEVFEREADAFTRFAQAQPAAVTLLIDTYDTEAAARKVVALAPQWQQQGLQVQAVRLDSGDLAEHARRVRAILDQGGLHAVKIVVSGGLDELQMARLVREAPIDGFGVGTALATSSDGPALDAVYKLCAYAGMPRRKRSEGKAGWPGAKQVYRRRAADGRWLGDRVCRLEEPAPARAQPLLQSVMRAGRRVADLPSLAESRAYARTQLAQMPAALRELDPRASVPAYPVRISPGLHRLARWVDRQAR